MADIKEVWIDNIVLTISKVGEVVTVRGQGQTYAEDGRPMRMYGPSDLTVTPADQDAAEAWIVRAHEAIQDEFDIPDTDLLPESPLPSLTPPLPPEPEVQARVIYGPDGPIFPQ